jgi:outer membrane murein-binding lipoprotein Lpp
MKSRQREVNIFNMSLLDILCGALGAFCFLMLSLFPDHAKVQQLQAQVQDLQQQTGGGGGTAQQAIQQARQQAQQAQQQAQQAMQERDQALADQNLAYFKVRWETAADVDTYLIAPSGKYFAPKKELVPAEKFAGTLPDAKTGPDAEQVWFTDAASDGSTYRLFAKLQSVERATPMPVKVNGYISARTHKDASTSSMGLADLGYASLTTPGQMLELGRLVFKQGTFEIYAGPMENTGGTSRRLDTPELPRLLHPPAHTPVASPTRP